MYLRGQASGGYDPSPCPLGWNQIDYQFVRESESLSNYVRTCLSIDRRFRQVLYLKSQFATSNPAECPAGWLQADLRVIREGSTSNNVRTCYM